MKTTFMAVTLMLSVVTVQAQNIAQYTTSPTPVSPLYIQQSEAFVQPQLKRPLPGTLKKMSGMLMVGWGAAIQIAGIALIQKQREEDRAERNTPRTCSSCKPGNSGSKGILGTFALLAGTGLATTGTVLWWTGSIRLNNSRAAQQAIRINVGPTSSLSYQF
jgi:hypothetical protein